MRVARCLDLDLGASLPPRVPMTGTAAVGPCGSESVFLHCDHSDDSDAWGDAGAGAGARVSRLIANAGAITRAPAGAPRSRWRPVNRTESEW